MGVYMKAARDQICNIVTEVLRWNPGVQLRVAFVGYRDVQDKRCALLDFTDDLVKFSKWVSACNAEGGSGGLADVMGAYHCTAGLSWASRNRMMIHIGDVPGHGTRMHKNLADDYPDGDPDGRTPESMLSGLRNQGVGIVFGRITPHTDKMFALFKDIHDIPEISRSRYIKVIDLSAGVTEFVPWW